MNFSFHFELSELQKFYEVWQYYNFSSNLKCYFKQNKKIRSLSTSIRGENKAYFPNVQEFHIAING